MPSIRPGAAARTASVTAVERAVEIVVDRKQVAREAGRAVDLGVAAIALGALADVLGVGQRAQQPVLELGDLGAQRACASSASIGLGGDFFVLVQDRLDVVEKRRRRIRRSLRFFSPCLVLVSPCFGPDTSRPTSWAV